MGRLTMLFGIILLALLWGCTSHPDLRPQLDELTYQVDSLDFQANQSKMAVRAAMMDNSRLRDELAETEMIAAELSAWLEDEYVRALRPIQFGFDSAHLDAIAVRNLLYNIGIMQTNYDWYVTLAGHCDSRGSDQYNLRLGALRGESIYRFIETHGGSMEQIRVRSHGEGMTLDGTNHAVNRRVEFEVSYEQW